jgi:hypothetical protein
MIEKIRELPSGDSRKTTQNRGMFQNGTNGRNKSMFNE